MDIWFYLKVNKRKNVIIPSLDQINNTSFSKIGVVFICEPGSSLMTSCIFSASLVKNRDRSAAINDFSEKAEQNSWSFFYISSVCRKQFRSYREVGVEFACCEYRQIKRETGLREGRQFTWAETMHCWKDTVLVFDFPWNLSSLI